MMKKGMQLFSFFLFQPSFFEDGRKARADGMDIGPIPLAIG
jgi:hypothetical protein